MLKATTVTTAPLRMSQKIHIRLFFFTVSQWSILVCTWLFHSPGFWFFSFPDFDLKFPRKTLEVQWGIQEGIRNRKPIIRRQQESMSPQNKCSYMLYANNSRVICQASLIYRYLTEQWATRSPLKRRIGKTTAASSLLSRILKKASEIGYRKIIE